MFDNITDENYLLFAIKNYVSPICIMSEFEDDMKRFKYIKRLIKKYRLSGDLKERLILNHIIVLGNVFGVEATTKLLFFKSDKEDYHIIKTFLIYLDYLDNNTSLIIDDDLIDVSSVMVDLEIAKKLQSIT